MKKLKFLVFTLIALFAGLISVNAASVGSAEELLSCLEAGGTCTLSGEITLSDRFVVKSGKTVVLDLNGKTLNLTHTTDNYSALIQGNLTIQGNGSVNITNVYGFGVTGSLTIKNGTFNHKNGIYLIGNWGTTTIENGTFNGDYCILNVFNGTGEVLDGVFNTNPHEDEEKTAGIKYYWGMLVTDGKSLTIHKGTFNQILSWKTNMLADDAKVTYVLEDDNIIYDPIVINADVTVDLNGHTVKYDDNQVTTGETGVFTVLRGGKLTVNDSKGTGKITAGTSGKVYTAIRMIKTGESTTGDAAELVVNKGIIEGYYYGIVGNGTYHNTKITINGGKICGNNANDNFGIFHPQDGEITINGGTIEGLTGIEMRAGSLTVNGGTIKGTSAELINQANGSGTTTNGAAIGVSQHTTLKAIKVVLNDGTFEGKAAIYQVNPHKFSAENYNKISIILKGGKYITTNNGEAVIVTENDRVNVTGGTYSTNVKDYVEAGYVSKLVNNNYTVYKENEISIATVTNGTITVDKTKASFGDTVTMTIKPNEDYLLKEVVVKDTSNDTVEVIDSKFVMPNSAVTISAVFEKIKYNILDHAGENGAVKFDKELAASGEEVTMTITPDEGYIISEINIIDKDNNIIEVKDNKFIMPESDVWVRIEFIKEIKTEIPVIDTTEKVEEVIVGVKEDNKIEEVLKESLAADEDLIEKVKDTDVKIVVDVFGVDKEKLDEKVVSAITEKAGKGVIAEYFDITIAVKEAKTDKEIATISELTKEIELTILLPENLKNTNKDINRKYFIIREHEGVVSTIEAKLSEDGNSLTFKSKDFSTYALAYEDKAIENKPEQENPKTGDNVIFYAIAGIVSICGLGVIIKNKKFN